MQQLIYHMSRVLKVGFLPQLITECCAENVLDYRIFWHFFVWLTFWFVINFSDLSQAAITKASFSTINPNTFLQPCIIIRERFVIDHKKRVLFMSQIILWLIKDTFSLWSITSMSVIDHGTFWHCRSVRKKLFFKQCNSESEAAVSGMLNFRWS